jgi:uracil-DNA glycosylase family 4
MSLQTNRRFLDEMGLGPAWMLRSAPASVSVPEPVFEPVFEPFCEPVAVSASEPVFVAQSVAAPAEQAKPVVVDAPAAVDAPVSAQAIAAMNWVQLAAAAASCTRCELCHNRSQVVFGRGATDATLIVLGSAPNGADEAAAAPVSGAPGQLLDNMLRAIDLAPQQVYRTNLIKCRPVSDAATAEQLAACQPYLERELALLTQARTVLAIGQQAARSVLPAGPLQHALGARAVVTTLHPDDVLRTGQSAGMADAKARIWGDLCLVKGAHAALA